MTQRRGGEAYSGVFGFFRICCLKICAPTTITFWKYNGKSISEHFLWWLKHNRNMDILISNLLVESILDFGKWQNRNFANYANWRNLRNFSLTTSQSLKLIPAADMKWKVHISILTFSCISIITEKCLKKWISHCIFKQWFGWGGDGGGDRFCGKK